jgi:hypothetical protein
MTDTLLITHTNHKKSIDSYLNWLFKEKKDFVILRSFYNSAINTTKVFVVLPVKEREFESDTQKLFTAECLDVINFPFKSKNLVDVKTIYSGNINEFSDFPRYLSSFKLNRTVPNENNARYSTIETYQLFKDYTVSKQKQCDNFSLVKSFINPGDSVTSIYRLIQRKFVTVVALEFSGKIQ